MDPSPGFGQYAITSLSLTVGSLGATGASLVINVTPNPFCLNCDDVYSVGGSLVPQSFGGVTPSFFNFILALPDGTFVDESLPLTPPPFSLNEPDVDRAFGIDVIEGPNHGVYGVLTSLTLHEERAVPEPSSLVLLGGALVASAAAWRRSSPR